MAIGWTAMKGLVESSSVHMLPDGGGRFRGSIERAANDALDRVDCIFAGTTQVSSAWTRARLIQTK